MIKKTQKSKHTRTSSPPAKKNNRASRIALSIVAIIVICIAGLWLVSSGVLTKISLAVNDFSIKNQMTEARNKAEPRFDSEESARIAALYDAGVIPTKTPNYSTKVDTCEIFSVSSGFTTTDWFERCSLSYQDYMATSLDRDALLAKLLQSHSIAVIFGTPNPYKSSSSKICDNNLYALNHNSSLGFLDLSRGHNSLCEIKTPRNSTYPAKAVKIIRSADITNIDHTKSYLYLSESNTYFTKSLGCGARGLFGCEKPIDTAITDFSKN